MQYTSLDMHVLQMGTDCRLFSHEVIFPLVVNVVASECNYSTTLFSDIKTTRKRRSVESDGQYFVIALSCICIYVVCFISGNPISITCLVVCVGVLASGLTHLYCNEKHQSANPWQVGRQRYYVIVVD